MAEYYNGGDCIDGKRVLIKFKKLVQQANAYIASPTGFKGRKYKCSRDGSMMSGQHECHEGTPDVRVYAEIEAPFESIVHAAEKRLLEMKKQVELGANKPQEKLK